MIERAVEAAMVGWGMDVLASGEAAELAGQAGATVFDPAEDLPPESVDRVIAVDAWPEPADVMRVLRPGGTFVLACDDEVATRLAYEPWGVELAFEHSGGRLLAIGRRVRSEP